MHICRPRVKRVQQLFQHFKALYKKVVGFDSLLEWNGKPFSTRKVYFFCPFFLLVCNTDNRHVRLSEILLLGLLLDGVLLYADAESIVDSGSLVVEECIIESYPFLI